MKKYDSTNVKHSGTYCDNVHDRDAVAGKIKMQRRTSSVTMNGKRVYNISFRDGNAAVKYFGTYCDNIYDREAVVEMIKTQRANSITMNSKRVYDKKKKQLEYTFENDNEKTVITIKNKDLKDNREFIETFDKWYEVDNKRKAMKAKKITVFAAISLIVGGCVLHNHSAGKRLSDLTDETKIHGGYDYTSEGHLVNPGLLHDCKFLEDRDKSVEERIADYCIRYNLGEAVEDKAIEKFEAYCNGDYKEAESINLKKVYKKNKN